MGARYDLALLPNGDLDIASKVMRVVPSDLQHQKDMCNSFPGEWKQYPQNGVGVPRYLKSSGNTLLILNTKITQALQADGYDTSRIKFSYDKENKLVITTNASR